MSGGLKLTNITGGPGISGLTQFSTYKNLLLQLSGGMYDIISWDPRGVGSLTVSVSSSP